MSWVAAAVAGGAVVGAGSSMGSAAMSSNAAKDAMRVQDRQFGQAQTATEQARQDAIRLLSPFRDIGVSSLSGLAGAAGGSARDAVAGQITDLQTQIRRLRQEAAAKTQQGLQANTGGAGLHLAQESGELYRQANELEGQVIRLTQQADAQDAQGSQIPQVPGIPQSLTAYLDVTNPAFQRYRTLLDAPTERFTPKAYTETPEFEAKRRLGEKYINRDLAARGLFSSGRATEVLNDFVSKLLVEDSDRDFKRQATVYGANVDAANQDIVRAEAGYTTGLNREMSLYDLDLKKYGLDLNANQTRYANLYGLANLGANAAAGAATTNTTAGTNQANLAVGSGNAAAAGIRGATQPYADAVSGIGRGAVTVGTLYGMGAFKGAGGDSGGNITPGGGSNSGVVTVNPLRGNQPNLGVDTSHWNQYLPPS